MPALTATKMNLDTLETLVLNALDIAGAKEVNVIVQGSERTLKIIVNGITVLHITNIEVLKQNGQHQG